jgi:hypothetical protein
MEWMLTVMFAVLVITAAFVLQMSSRDYGLPETEHFMDFIRVPSRPSDEFASVDQGLPLSDVLPVRTGLSGLSASDCAATDSTRQMELGGQYVQRTNNYRREYPDNCSSPLSDFVGGFYQPKEGGVPCNGLC